jgi:hypothetical protein
MTKTDVKLNIDLSLFANLELIINILHILSMLEKALNRVARRITRSKILKCRQCEIECAPGQALLLHGISFHMLRWIPLS